MNENYWDEIFNTEAWIGFMQYQATNTNTDFWLEDEYVHHVCIYETIDSFMNYCNTFVKLPNRTKSYLTKKFALWKNQVQIHKITRTIITEDDATNQK